MTGAARGRRGWAEIALYAGFGVVYAAAIVLAVVTMVSTLIGLGRVGFTLNAVGWAVWVVAVVFPLLGYGVATAIGRHRPMLQRVLIMLAGAGLVAVFWLDVNAYVAARTATLITA